MSASGKSPPLNVNNWTPILVEDFDTDVPMGQVIGSSAYADKISAFPTGWRTSKPWQTGMYDNSRLEVKDSCLITHVATITDARGTAPRVTTILPKLSTDRQYRVSHGRFTVRFRADEIPGYKIAWMLWPISDAVWPAGGEIDFPEQCLRATNMVSGFMHRQDATEGGDQNWAKGASSACDGDWHTATITWKPGGWRTAECTFGWDGVQIGHFTDRVPVGPMRWGLQTEPDLHPKFLGYINGKRTYAKPDPAVAGIIEVDWIVAYRAN
ncbi:MAG: glycoside hydrolase family 16 protein [Ilumatobacteraceae bacterium]